MGILELDKSANILQESTLTEIKSTLSKTLHEIMLKTLAAGKANVETNIICKELNNNDEEKMSIDLFFKGDTNSISEIEYLIKRGVSALINNNSLVEQETSKIKNFDKNEVYNILFKSIFDDETKFDTKELKEHLQYFRSNTNSHDFKYNCLYYPIFKSLLSYKTYLTKGLSLDKIFTPITNDFRDEKSPSGFSYEQIKDKEQFAEIEQKMFDETLIDKDYNFIERKGNKSIFIASYKIMIAKGLFYNPFIKNDTRINYTENDIKTYLDIRYNIKKNQQFRKLTQNDIESLVKSNKWLKSIRSGRESYCK